MFDPCVPLRLDAATTSEVQRAGLHDALTLWRDRGVTAFDAMLAIEGAREAASGPMIELAFEDAAATFHGVYDADALRVLINRDLVARAQVAVVIAHELGHVFGLEHIERADRASLMNPGNLMTPPTDEDQRALEALWGSCARQARQARSE